MKRDSTKSAADTTEEKLFDNWFDPIEIASSIRTGASNIAVNARIARNPFAKLTILLQQGKGELDRFVVTACRVVCELSHGGSGDSPGTSN